MCRSVTWQERYKIALSESLSIKDIMKLRNVGQPKAISIRKKAVEYCLVNGMEDLISVGVPTDVVLNITGFDLSYYFNKMKLEFEMENLSKMLIK